MVVLKRKHAVIAGIFTISLSLFGCGSENHSTQVQLPNGVSCRSVTSGTFLDTSRDISCTDSNGKVVGSYKSD